MKTIAIALAALLLGTHAAHASSVRISWTHVDNVPDADWCRNGIPGIAAPCHGQKIVLFSVVNLGDIPADHVTVECSLLDQSGPVETRETIVHKIGTRRENQESASRAGFESVYDGVGTIEYAAPYPDAYTVQCDVRP